MQIERALDEHTTRRVAGLAATIRGALRSGATPTGLMRTAA